jgi:peroxiredoxin
MVIALLAIATDEAVAQAERLTLKSVDGKEVSLADHRGQVVVLTFNANWTPMINKSLPALQRIANLYEGRGVVFYWVSINSARAGEKNFASDADLKAFAQKNGLALTVLRDPERKAFSEFGLDVIPSIVILDRAGKVYKKQAGFDAAPTRGYKSVVRVLNRLLGKEPADRPHAPI